MNGAFMRRVLLSLTLAAATACKSAPIQQPTNSGSLGIVVVTVNGKQLQKLYLPQCPGGSTGVCNDTIAVLDATYDGTGQPLIDTIQLNHPDNSGPSATAASPTTVVSIGYSSSYVDFINPLTDTVVDTVQLPGDITDGGFTSFSGGGGLATGVVIDSANNRAIIAVTEGFLPVDLTTHAFGTLVPAAPSENFGFWPEKEWILAPFYNCLACSNTFPRSGFQIVDMSKGEAYLLASDAGSPVGDEPDSADIDPATGLAIVPDESSGDLLTLNLNAATLNADAGTFVAPLGQASALIDNGYTGVAVDPVGHRALLEQEHSTGVGLANLPSASVPGILTPAPTGVTADIPAPDSSGWANSGDPHGVAVTVGLVSGTPVGFLAKEDASMVARIDLDKFASAPNTSGVVAPSDFAPLVTFIPAHN